MDYFDHEKLDVYQAAIELIVLIDAIVEHLPRARAYLADQLQRAGISVPLNIAEGAGEYSTPEVMGEGKRFLCELIRNTESQRGRRHALALLPLMGLEEGEEIEFEGKQRVHLIALTPPALGSPVMAYLFEPARILVFKPTPFLTCEGHFLSLMADVNPWISVGKSLFLLGRKKLVSELKGPVEVVGLSLGGALVLHFTDLRVPLNLLALIVTPLLFGCFGLLRFIKIILLR